MHVDSGLRHVLPDPGPHAGGMHRLDDRSPQQPAHVVELDLVTQAGRGTPFRKVAPRGRTTAGWSGSRRPAGRSRDQAAGLRMIRASPWPPPPHSVAPPSFTARRRIWSASVSPSRAPEAPIGCPSATAPPFTFTIDSSTPSIRVAF